MASVKLLVGGKEYQGWKSARVVRGIESVSGGFYLDVSERWDGRLNPWPILSEDECELKLDDTTVIVGWVDRRTVSYDANQHGLAVEGRDRTGDLVDCSAVPKKYKNVSVETLANRVCEPFGIAVTRQGGLVLPLVKSLTVDPGDSAFEAIERACRMAGVLPVSDGRGGLLLTRAGTARASTSLVEGGNILSASGTFDATGRFRTYIVRGQHKGSDDFSGESAAFAKGTAEDATVRRSERVLIVRPEGNVTNALAKTRAEYEAKIRAGRGDSVTITVQGWTMANGAIWPVNALVPVKSPMLGIDGDMLITQATHSLDDGGGSLTELSLKRPDAFLPEPVVTVASEGAWKEIARGV